jgi:hypothetical protein
MKKMVKLAKPILGSAKQIRRRKLRLFGHVDPPSLVTSRRTRYAPLVSESFLL